MFTEEFIERLSESFRYKYLKFDPQQEIGKLSEEEQAQMFINLIITTLTIKFGCNHQDGEDHIEEFNQMVKVFYEEFPINKNDIVNIFIAIQNDDDVLHNEFRDKYQNYDALLDKARDLILAKIIAFKLTEEI